MVLWPFAGGQIAAESFVIFASFVVGDSVCAFVILFCTKTARQRMGAHVYMASHARSLENFCVRSAFERVPTAFERVTHVAWPVVRAAACTSASLRRHLPSKPVASGTMKRCRVEVKGAGGSSWSLALILAVGCSPARRDNPVVKVVTHGISARPSRPGDSTGRNAC